MAQCAQCGATILFGGHRIGDHRFCSARCRIAARPLIASEASVEECEALREDILVLVDELQLQRAQLAELAERVDFLERALAQVRQARAPEAT